MGRELKSWVEHELWSEREKNEQKSVSKAEVRGGLEEEEAEQNNIHTVRQRDNDVAEHEASATRKGYSKRDDKFTDFCGRRSWSPPPA